MRESNLDLKIENSEQTYNINPNTILNFRDILCSSTTKKALNFYKNLNQTEQQQLTRKNLLPHQSTALYLCLMFGKSLNLIKLLITANQDPDVLTDSKAIFENIFIHSPNARLKNQKIILSFFLDFFTENKIYYDPVDILKKIMQSKSDDLVADFLDHHQNILNPQLCQILLDIACVNYFNPLCISMLVAFGARLNSDHINNEGFKKYLLKNNSTRDPHLLNLLDLLKNTNTPIPIISDYFINSGSIKNKELIISSFQQCDHKTLLMLENTIIQAPIDAYAGRNLKEILCDHIQMVFKQNPHYRIFNPIRFEYIFLIAARTQHTSLLHTLLDQGLSLSRVFKLADVWPQKLLFLNVQKNRLGDVLAFYINDDPKLLNHLGSISYVNRLGRTPSHYATLAIAEFSDKKAIRTKLSYENIDLSVIKAHKKFSNLFRTHILTLQFELLGSEDAFAYSNLNANAHKPDMVDHTPLDYAAMLVDRNKKIGMMNTFSRFLAEILVQMPSVLITLIVQYMADFEGNPEELIVDWARSLIKNMDLFSDLFQEHIISPLKSHLVVGKDAKIIANKTNASIAWIGLQAFNLATLVGIKHRNEEFKKDNQMFSQRKHPIQHNSRPVQCIPKPISAITTSFGTPTSRTVQPISNRPNSSSSSLSQTFKHAYSSQHFYPAKRNKKRVRLQEPEDTHWKELRTKIADSLDDCYLSGGLRKPDLENTLIPFVKKIEDARNAAELDNALTNMKDSLDDINSSLSRIATKYGMSSLLIDILFNSVPSSTSLGA